MVLLRKSFGLCSSGEARTALKWADGKIVKNEVDMQVCVTVLLPCANQSKSLCIIFGALKTCVVSILET